MLGHDSYNLNHTQGVSLDKVSTSLSEQPSSLNPYDQCENATLMCRRKMKLKSYQLAGLNWLILLHTNRVNAILADEMGFDVSCLLTN